MRRRSWCQRNALELHSDRFQRRDNTSRRPPRLPSTSIENRRLLLLPTVSPLYLALASHIDASALHTSMRAPECQSAACLLRTNSRRASDRHQRRETHELGSNFGSNLSEPELI